MGLIIKNGIRYFGDNSVELTQAQYDALSQAEKLNGTTYYITDGQNITTASAVTYDNTNSGMTATNVQGAIDEVNSNRAYAYRLTSTTSFYSACSGTVFTDNYGLGNFLDTKVHAVRNSFSTTAVNYIHDSVGGAIMFAQVFAYSANYYCGTVNTYHADNKVYGSLGFVNFQYMNGTYVIQYISNSRI